MVTYLNCNVPGSVEEQQASTCIPSSPSWREPLPPNRDVAPVPSAQLDADAGLGGDSHPINDLDEDHELPVAEDTNGALPCAAEPEPAHLPSSKADKPAVMHPDPWDCFDVGDLQISSREPALISMMESDHDEDIAHVLERLPDLKVKQLSLMAVKLFKGLIPEQCLTYIYIYKRDHEEGLEHLAPTVLAILEHCEKLHTCVISTCLGEHSTEAAERAQVLEHWIDVALDYPEGTVPYLGTILTHLASLHKDQDSKDEYKVIALMKELQGACQELQVVPDMNFMSWFNNVKRLSELER
ncbi:PREDICTED: ral guanine nucleotide dissociation stimulator-like [Dipodomys ordii]|uniref:Ral guanine nucleotide dissociation stimulator-like n=1 Tax=Dipodomys ordii TaxID=10020 RepID=A0A1S3GJQ0_DIPOR|nr:PREDICTED: ral guanine nucleotide dissociation stimulator-like [Dipodomys ordii]